MTARAAGAVGRGQRVTGPAAAAAAAAAVGGGKGAAGMGRCRRRRRRAPVPSAPRSAARRPPRAERLIAAQRLPRLPLRRPRSRAQLEAVAHISQHRNAIEQTTKAPP
ncbi:Protein of unknown function [Gryllus bimaculatus]|nr:Protein of unknown function [Gryllus bimaculatus]